MFCDHVDVLLSDVVNNFTSIEHDQKFMLVKIAIRSFICEVARNNFPFYTACHNWFMAHTKFNYDYVSTKIDYLLDLSIKCK